MTSQSSIVVTLSITNTGTRAGAEIAQVYARDESSRLPRPMKELVGFEKVFLEPGQTTSVVFNLDKHAVGYYDDDISKWIAERGTFLVMIGASSNDIRYVVLQESGMNTYIRRHRATIHVEEDFTWVF